MAIWWSTAAARAMPPPPPSPACSPRAMSPTTSTARPSPPPAPAAWPRWTPRSTSTVSDPPMLGWLKRDELAFPPLEAALREPNGLLAAGGDLSPERLIAAYRHGCFPWYAPGQPILWWSPDPRTVLFPDELHVSRSLAKVLRQQRFEVSFDRDFAAVIAACAAPRSYANGTWITDEMRGAYEQLHQLGHAHSVEVWQDGELVGGLYGLAFGLLFFGESMFSRRDNASKVGFVTLVRQL